MKQTAIPLFREGPADALPALKSGERVFQNHFHKFPAG
jgi:hypothetical protein